jgi:8-oxo-dGTP pyrophosphatase MutT (NUDIX family)
MAYWEQQLAKLKQAMADERPIAHEELLMMRDGQGRLARQMQPGPEVTPRPAGVLLLLYPQAGELWLPLTVRSSDLPLHRGEISLPGGRVDPSDNGPVGAALREAHEEVGIDPALVTILGMLASFYIPPSNHLLTPVVGYALEAPLLRPAPREVAAAFSVPLRQLLDPATIIYEQREWNGIAIDVPYFALEGYKVWGATALLLSELVARLRRLEGYNTQFE